MAGLGLSHALSMVTGSRRILVIGSQCESLGEHARLAFLPRAAEDLFAVMTDPALGQCIGALPERGLLIDPTTAETKEALWEAFRLASRAEATLLLAFIGHGHFIGNDYYYLARDAKVDPGPDPGIQIVQQIGNAYLAHGNVSDLVLLVDTCHSGLAAERAASQWVGEYKRGEQEIRKLRFQILTAAAPDREAYDGCFTRAVTRCLRGGLDDVYTEELRCRDVERIVRRECLAQQPQFLEFRPGVPLARDEDLWLARNAARVRPAWAGTWAAGEIARLTADFQPTSMLERVVAASGEHRSVALVGVAGAGKSTLAAALARPEVTGGVVPAGFAHAVVFLTGGLLAQDVARLLADQFTLAVPGFAAAREELRRGLTADELRRLDALQLDVIGPLRRLGSPGGSVVRIVADGLDQLPTADEGAIRAALADLAAGPGLDHVRLITTARPDTGLPAGTQELPAGRLDAQLVAAIDAYLDRRGVPPDLHAAIATRADGNWLVASKLADLVLSSPGEDPAKLPTSLGAIYAEDLRRAGASATDRWRRELRPVLGALAVAGAGPILPLKLLCAASARLGGLGRPLLIRDVLFDLRGLVVRGRPGTDDEHVGLFHATLAEYLLDPSSGPFGIVPVEPHRALADALAELAPAQALANLTPAEVHAPRDPLHRYAAAREPDHLWAIGEHRRLIESLGYRRSITSAENLRTCQAWYDRLRSVLNPDDPDMLKMRFRIAVLAGESLEAPQLFRDLLPDQERVLGPDHLDTLMTRVHIADWVGRSGEPGEALSHYLELLPGLLHILGPGHPQTLTLFHNVAFWAGEVGEASDALDLFRELVKLQERILGSDHPDTLVTRGNLADRIGRAGDPRQALDLLRKLLADQQRVLGPDHTATLTTRYMIASWTGEVGEASEALRLFGELLQDQERVLGPGHPATVMTLAFEAIWSSRVLLASLREPAPSG